MDDDSEPLLIAGRPVSRTLFESREIRRCGVDECQSYCCMGGVYIHTSQVKDILDNQALILPHLAPDRQDPGRWFDGVEEPDNDYPEAGPCMSTTVVPDPTHLAGQTCIFLDPERRCSLQKAGIANGEHPWRFKPFYCALHPLVLSKGELVLAEDDELYKEGGSCNRPNPGQFVPLYRLFDVETKLVLGEGGYAELAAMAPDGGGTAA